MAGSCIAYGAIASGPLRRYVIDCKHATTDLFLERRPSEDLNVLTNLLFDHRRASAAAVAQAREDETAQPEELCDCEPTEEQLARLRARMT